MATKIRSRCSSGIPSRLTSFALLLIVFCFHPLSAETGSDSTAAVTGKPGGSVFGKNNFIEYVTGNLPIIISVPHGGNLRPDFIPKRELGTAGRQDVKTEELAREIVDSFRKLTGKFPHVIINRLHREKLDANRELFDAAQDDSTASRAWEEFHGFIEAAQRSVEQQFGAGLYIDLHGHRHDRQVVELGYLLVSRQLEMNDRQLDSIASEPVTSFGRLVGSTGKSPSRMIRGDLSFGALLQNHGIATVPSPEFPDPEGKPYFSGGYNLEQHSAFTGHKFWGIQIELPTDVREDEARRKDLAETLTKCILEFLDHIRN